MRKKTSKKKTFIFFLEYFHTKIPLALPLVCALMVGPGALVGIICGCAVSTLGQYLRNSKGAVDQFGEAFFNHIM